MPRARHILFITMPILVGWVLDIATYKGALKLDSLEHIFIRVLEPIIVLVISYAIWIIGRDGKANVVAKSYLTYSLISGVVLLILKLIGVNTLLLTSFYGIGLVLLWKLITSVVIVLIMNAT